MQTVTLQTSLLSSKPDYSRFWPVDSYCCWHKSAKLR
jgi:hypothetical protein